METLRNEFLVLINKRREDFKKPDFEDRGDLVTILLHDDLFLGNDELIIDECFTFFFAGS